MFNFKAAKKNRQCTEDFKGNKSILYITAMVDMCHRFSKPTDYPKQKVNPNVNYMVEVIMMCQ